MICKCGGDVFNEIRSQETKRQQKYRGQNQRETLRPQQSWTEGLKAPRGYGWLTNPKKAAYNRVYNRTSVSV